MTTKADDTAATRLLTANVRRALDMTRDGAPTQAVVDLLAAAEKAAEALIGGETWAS